MVFISKGLKRSFKTENEKNVELTKIDNSGFRDKDIIDMRKEISNIDSQQAKNEAARSQAIANKAGEKTGKAIDEADLTNKANAAITANTKPSSLSDEVITKIGALGYTWDSVNKTWKKRKGAM